MPQNPQPFQIGSEIHKRLSEDPFADARDIYGQLASDPEGSKYLDSFGDVDKAMAALEASMSSYKTFTGNNMKEGPTSWGEMMTPEGGWTGRGLISGAKNVGAGALSPLAGIKDAILNKTAPSLALDTASIAGGPLTATLRQAGKTIEPNVRMMEQLDPQKLRSSAGGQARGPMGMSMSGDQLSEAIKAVASLLPGIGPWAAGIGEKAGEGKLGEAAGEALWMAPGLGRKPIVKAGTAATKKVGKTASDIGLFPAAAVGAGITSLATGFHPWAGAAGIGWGARQGYRNWLKAKNAPAEAAAAAKEIAKPRVAPPKVQGSSTERFRAEPVVKKSVSPPAIQWAERPKAVAEKTKQFAPPPIQGSSAARQVQEALAPATKKVAPPPLRRNTLTEPPENPSTTIRKRIAGVDPSLAKFRNADKLGPRDPKTGRVTKKTN